MQKKHAEKRGSRSRGLSVALFLGPQHAPEAGGSTYLQWAPWSGTTRSRGGATEELMRNEGSRGGSRNAWSQERGITTISHIARLSEWIPIICLRFLLTLAKLVFPYPRHLLTWHAENTCFLKTKSTVCLSKLLSLLLDMLGVCCFPGSFSVVGVTRESCSGDHWISSTTNVQAKHHVEFGNSDLRWERTCK